MQSIHSLSFYILLILVNSLAMADEWMVNNPNYQFRLPYKFNKSTESGLYNGVIHNFQSVGCGGYLRAAYLQTDIETVSNQQAYGIGGNVLCGLKWDDSLNIQLGLFGAFDPGLNSQNNAQVQGDFFKTNKNDYLLLGEAVLNVSMGRFQAHLGRQRFDSPHMDQDDLRLIPNLFEAYLIDYHAIGSLYAGGGLVSAAAGWENGGNAAEFVDIATALGGKGNLAWLAWARYQQQNGAANAWMYHIVDNVDIFYGEWLYRGEMTEAVHYRIGLQVDLGRDTGAAQMGTIDAKTWGVMTALNWRDITFSAAYNANYGASGALSSVGGGPFFTSLEDQTLDAIAADHSAHAVLFSLEYQPLPNLLLGVAKGVFLSQNKQQYHKQEVNVYATFQWQEHVSVDFMYADINDKNSAEDTRQFRLVMNYHF